MKPREYRLLERCIEEGLMSGYRRAFKHTDSPTEEHLLDVQETSIMGEINEYFSFAPDEDCEQ